MTKNNPFNIFKQHTKKVFINALDADIEYRDLTLKESDDFNALMVKDYDVETGKPTLDMKAATTVKYQKVSAMLIQPKMSVAELQGLSVDAGDAIAEILSLLTDDETDLVDDEGN